MNAKTSKLSPNEEAVLKAAEEEFAKKGFYGARVDEIARLSGINKRIIYKMFISKEELYKRVLERAYKKMARAESGIFTEYDTCEDAIRKVVKGYFNFLKNNPTYISLILWENLNKGQYVKDIDFSEIKNRVVDYIHKIIEDGKKNGEFKETTHTEQVVLSIMTFTFSYFSNRYTLSKLLQNIDFEKDFAKRIDNVTEMIITYIKK